MDFCGTVPSDESLQIYYDTLNNYGAIANCRNFEVTSTNRFNDDWWQTGGNAANVNGDILCARLAQTEDSIIVWILFFVFFCVVCVCVHIQFSVLLIFWIISQ